MSLLGSLGSVAYDIVANDKTSAGTEAATAGFEKAGAAIGAAITGIGASMVLLTDHARKLNAELSVSALQLSIPTSEMRELALQTTNVTFPLSEVQQTFDLLVRAGMRNTEQIKATATAFDTLGDATGGTASVVTDTLIPAFNAFGIPLTDAWGHVDTFTHLMRNTTIELSDFSGMMSYLSADIADMDITLEQSVAVLEAMADRGIQGSAATREFRKAITAANGDIGAFYAALGLTAGEVAAYAHRIESASGMTQKFADAANQQYSTIDKLSQGWDELSLRIGSALEPLDAVGATLSAGGPLLMGISGGAIAAEKLAESYGEMSVRSAAAAASSRLLMFALNPVTLALGAAAVAAIYLNSEYSRISSEASALAGAQADLADAVSLTDDEIQAHIDTLELAASRAEAWARAGGMAADALGDGFTEMQGISSMGWNAMLLRNQQATYENALAERSLNREYSETAGLISDLERQYDSLGDAIRRALDLPETLSDQERSVERAEIAMERAAENLARVRGDSSSTELDLRDAELGMREAVDSWDDAKRRLSETRAAGESEILGGMTIEDAQAQHAAIGEQISSAQRRLAATGSEIDKFRGTGGPAPVLAEMVGGDAGSSALMRALMNGGYTAPSPEPSAQAVNQSVTVNISVASTGEIAGAVGQNQALADFFRSSMIQRGVR
jgi:hypothetical protein